MKINIPSLLRPLFALTLAATAFAALSLAPANVSAQSDTDTRRGIFKDTDGNKGTFVTTITKTDTGSTEQTVFTRKSDQATSTDTTTSVKNADGTRTVNYSHNDFGTTAQYVSTKTVTPEKHGDAYATGTFTNAAGVSGTFTTLESNVGNVETVSATYTTANGTTTDLRLKDSELRFTAVKTVALAPDGTVTANVNTRYITHY